MSYKEAVTDGIKIVYGSMNVYYPRCRFCGEEVKSFHYIPTRYYYCPDCRKKKKVLLSTGIFD